MATRLVGVDSDSPRLPDVVITASVGTTADDLAAGDAPGEALTAANEYTDAAIAVVAPSGGSFVGSFATVDRPAADTVAPGFYYWDLTTAQPYWSDGAIWRGSAAVTAPDPEDLGLEVTFTLDPAATSFVPWITLIDGATGTVNWYDSDDTLITSGENPTITAIPDDNIVTMRVQSGAALVMSEVEIINLGFDHTQDTGPETPDAAHDHDPQPVTAISSLSGLTNLKYFMAADTPLSGLVDFTDLPNILAVECYQADVDEVRFTGTAINRLCIERCRITELDLTPIASSIRDLRCAVGQGGPVAFTSDEILTNLWHYCVRDQTVTAHIPQSLMPALIQNWAWNTGVTTWDVPTSPVVNSMILHHNALTSATLDSWLIALAAGSTINGTFDASHAEPPTAASAAAIDTLEGRGWSLLIPVAVGPDEGWTYSAPTQTAWPSSGITGLAATPNVTSGVLTWSSNTYSRVIMQPGGRSAGDVFFEVVVDRADIDGAAGSDFWAIIVNCNASGNTGLKALIRWPEVTPTAATGITIGSSSFSGHSAATPVRVNPNPAGWTDAGAHKIGLLHQGAVASVILDGVKVWQAGAGAIDTLAGGGYVGVGGDTDSTTRTYASWGLTNI